MALSLFVSGICGIFLIVSTFLVEIKILRILASSTLNGYAIGALNTYIFANEYWQKSLSEYTLEDIGNAVVALNIYCTVLIILSNISKLDTLVIKSLQFKIRSAHKSTYIYLTYLGLFISTIQIYLIVSGQAIFNAASSITKSTENNSNLTNFDIYLSVGYFLCNLAPFLIGILMGWSSSKQNIYAVKNYPLYFMCFSCFLWLLIAGRRDILFGAISVFIGFIISNCNYKSIISRQFLSIKKVCVISLVILLVWFGFNFFAYLRFYSYTYYKTVDTTLISYLLDAFSSYLDILTDPSKQEKLKIFNELVEQNLSTRTFVFGFLVTSVHVVTRIGALMGQDFISNLLVSSPSNFFIDKTTVIAGENLYNYFYNLSLPDIANSYITSAFLDFSWIGLLIYPLVIYLIYNFLTKITIDSNLILLYITLISSLLQNSLNGAESTTITFFVNCRQFLLFYLITYLSKVLFFKTK
ncbi:hypothetical protein [Pseudanabaena sp. Chao 1811]|uniref:hypothetical protein n=1 Tax=Pseudanabaena sp. Chao 1811 TaxID=2963092 RepID=UPI0022F3C4A0|nr:hypothetical protein [Pseudanabaena sp. Chao 1811]